MPRAQAPPSNGLAPGAVTAPDRKPGPVVPGRMRARGHWRWPAESPAAPQPPSIVRGMGLAEEEPDGRLAGRPAMPAPLAEAAALARKHPLETVCVLLIGVGGLIFPFPMWLVGGLVALRSRRLDGRDKRLALLGPPLFAVVCLLILGLPGTAATSTCSGTPCISSACCCGWAACCAPDTWSGGCGAARAPGRPRRGCGPADPGPRPGTRAGSLWGQYRHVRIISDTAGYEAPVRRSVLAFPGLPPAS